MRPLRLELSNFLSYRDTVEIDLADIGAAVILGPNGAGKTSIVEAMSWALFAEGRGRGPDDFVSAGKTVCRVVFDFELNGVRYRVERQREIGRTSRSYLGLFVDTNDHDGFGWQPVGADHIADTQAEIERVLGMDGRTWIATSFIGQGRADRFTAMPPGERKKLLADVLDLGSFEARAEAAKSHERMLAGEAQAVLRAITTCEETLAREPEARDLHAVAVRRREEAANELEAAQRELAVARRGLEVANDAAAATVRMQERLVELRAAREEAGRRTAGEIDRAEREADRLAGEVRDRDLALGKLRAAASMVEDLEAQALQSARALAEAEEGEQAIAAEVSQHEAAAALAEQDVERLAAALAEIADRRTLLQRGAASCWVCRQGLDDILRADLMSDLEEEEATLGGAQVSARGVVAERTDAAARGREALGRYRAELARLRDLAERSRAAAERARADGERLVQEERLLEAARARLEEIASALEDLAETRTTLQGPSEEELTLAAQMADTATVSARLQAAEEQLRERELIEREATSALSAAAEAVGRAEAVLSELGRARSELEGSRRRLSEVSTARERYAFWIEGYGRDGLPALVIENALPELQDEANRLLERLSDGRLSVQVESLRATKGGALRETLDIRVADESDERPLEDFSGGERQAVDLALRIGLSRLLARRAGRPMETLILDEAFTALDASRRQRAVEVVHTLAQEFGTVLFVTHLPEFADAFPVRLEVTKNGTSRVEVVTA